MSRHFDTGPGLCESPDEATRHYGFNHTMMRIKDPERSLDFYTRVLGMRLLRRLDFDELNFSLYFLAFLDEHAAERAPSENGARTTWTFAQQGVLELTHNWGTEDDPSVHYHNGNDEPQGFGHIAVTVPDVYAACERFDNLGVEFVKRPDAGKLQGIAFIKDPDGYWVEIVQADMMERQGMA